MATFVKGDAVPNASGYELLEKVGESYNSLATASEINFEVSAMDFAAGDHLLAVKAKGDGVNYSDSDPSDTVTYTVEAGEEVDTNLMPLDARLDENTVFAANETSQQWGVWKGTSPVVEDDHVKIYCDLTQSLQGIRKAAPDNLTDGQTVKFSFYAKIGEGETLDKNLQFYVAGSKNTVFTGLTTEWKLCEWTVAYDSTVWDRMQFSMNTAQTTAITIYLKDFRMELA